MKSRDLDLQSSEVACAWPTNVHTHTKLTFQQGMCPGSLKLQRQQAYFFLLGLFRIFAIELGWLRVSGWPECAFQMVVCHRMIDMLPAVASTNHTPTIVVQQPNDKQHNKHSHLWGHPSPDRIDHVFPPWWLQGQHWANSLNTRIEIIL